MSTFRGQGRNMSNELGDGVSSRGLWWRVPAVLAVWVGLPFGAAVIINRIPTRPSDDTLITECAQAGGRAIYTSNDDGEPHFITCDMQGQTND